MTKRPRKKQSRKENASTTALNPAAIAPTLPVLPHGLRRWFPLMVLVLVLLVFGQCLTFKFVDWDDNLNVYENPYLLSMSAQGLHRLWSAPYASLYVPLVYTSYFIELLLADLLCTVAPDLLHVSAGSPEGFFRVASSLMHLDNVLLHWLACLCVFWLLQRLTGGFSLGVVLGTLLFAVHPLQVEPVAWVTGRKDLLAWALTLASLVVFLKAWDGKRMRPLPIAIATLFYIGALFSKPTAIVTPALAAAIAWYLSLRSREVWWVLLTWFCVAFIAFWIHRGPQSDLKDAPFLLEWWKRPFLAADNMLFYFQKLVFPFPLLPIYPRKIADVFSSPLVWVKLPLLIVLGTFLVRERIWILATILLVIPLLPVLGLVPFIYQYFSVVADRYFYGSMLGVALFLAVAVNRFHVAAAQFGERYARLLVGICVVVVMAYAGIAAAQARHWKSSETLWRHELAYHPRCVHALYNLASEAAQQGRLEEAIQMYERILVVDPYYAAAYTNLMLLNEELGRKQEVQTLAQAALELPPNCAENFLARGHAFLSLGRPAEAAESFKAAIFGLPEDAPAHNSLGMAYLALGDVAQAEAAFRRAIALNPALVAARLNLANILRKRGDLAGAAAEYRSVLEIEPHNAKARKALQAIGTERR